MLKWLGGTLLAAALLLRPESAANGAREAMAQWARVVAPSLFPFMALMPLLTCRETGAAYESLLGGLTRRVCRLPGPAATALAVGMLAGSPAGCVAARRVASETPMTRGQLQRLAVSGCGLSPAFYISGIGAAMLNDPALGHRLLRAQLAAQLLMPVLLIPFFKDETPVAPEPMPPSSSPVAAILNVCGFMALFGALAAAMGDLFGEIWGRFCLCLMDVTSGARILCALSLPLTCRLPLIAALTGFGGFCVCAQNLAILKEIIHPAAFVAARIAAGALMAGITALQTVEFSVKFTLLPLHASCLFACLLAVPAIFMLRKTIF